MEKQSSKTRKISYVYIALIKELLNQQEKLSISWLMTRLGVLWDSKMSSKTKHGSKWGQTMPESVDMARGATQRSPTVS
ncbi:MAG: hypothetical protein ABH886_08280 [Candidatus Desantisbacteria bacterium]